MIKTIHYSSFDTFQSRKPIKSTRSWRPKIRTAWLISIIFILPPPRASRFPWELWPWSRREGDSHAYHASNSRRTVTIRDDVDTKASKTDEIIADTRARFLPEFQQRYPDVNIILEGQAEEAQKTGNSMRKALMLCIF